MDLHITSTFNSSFLMVNYSNSLVSFNDQHMSQCVYMSKHTYKITISQTRFIMGRSTYISTFQRKKQLTIWEDICIIYRNGKHWVNPHNINFHWLFEFLSRSLDTPGDVYARMSHLHRRWHFLFIYYIFQVYGANIFFSSQRRKNYAILFSNIYISWNIEQFIHDLRKFCV